MASLQNTTTGTFSASTSLTSPALLTNTNDDFAEYTGTVNIPSSYNSATNYVDLFTNNGGYERMHGILSWWCNQSQFTCGSFRFHLSTYGLATYALIDSSGYYSVSRISDGYPYNYLRFYNTVGTVWGNGQYYFNVRVAGLGGYTFASSYLTERVR
jgi:hypothetical protein